MLGTVLSWRTQLSVTPELFKGSNQSNSISKFFLLGGFSGLSVCVHTGVHGVHKVSVDCQNLTNPPSVCWWLCITASPLFWKKWKCFLVPLAEEPEPLQIPARTDQRCPEQLQCSAAPSPACWDYLFPWFLQSSLQLPLKPNLTSLQVFALPWHGHIVQVYFSGHPSNTRKCSIGRYTLQIKILVARQNLAGFFFSPMKRSQSSFKEQTGENQVRSVNTDCPLFIFVPNNRCNFHKDLRAAGQGSSFQMFLSEQVPWAALDKTVPGCWEPFLTLVPINHLFMAQNVLVGHTLTGYD